MVGGPKTTVVKGIEAVRDQLRSLGVRGLDEAGGRRTLAEWLLATRIIQPADLDVLADKAPGPPDYDGPHLTK